MFALVVAKATETSTTGVLLVVTTGITALGVVLGAAFGPVSEHFSRRDKLKSYKRNIYRNFLDHAYWYRDSSTDDNERQRRAGLYVADWHRIWLIGSPQVRAAVDGLRDAGSLTLEQEQPVIEAFVADLGLEGLNDAS